MTSLKTTKTTRSPLGDASTYYAVKRAESGSIVDRPDEGFLEFYPAGGSKPSALDSRPRQVTLRAIYEHALSAKAEEKLFPFGKKAHTLELVAEPDNKYDRHAVLIKIKADVDHILHKENSRDIGYVPKRISKMISENIDRFSGGKVYKVKSNVYGKYYQVKVILYYGEQHKGMDAPQGIGRFVSILED